MLTALESPHVLRVFNAGIHEDVPFIATDIAESGSCEDCMVPDIGVPQESAIRWVSHALIGLEYCHRLGVLHRDITPANIFLHTPDHALLGDFGAAALLDEASSAEAAGNQRCRAPEGFGGRLTVQSDIYSIGVTLWRLVTGKWPFDAVMEADLAAIVSKGAKPRLRDIAPHVHRSPASVIERALDPDPASRYESARDLHVALSRTRLHDRRWVREAPRVGEADRFLSTRGSRIVVIARINGLGV